ncbi:aminodeoxychorismate synthase [[Candida] jaroonii]|uniref:Aminodeoxychorismate synthase n=1 Tax=[Candida] jaroonii TaxID=467808 RepID=A0ACA9YCN6_9ASCO|nr:aminodeoxychorismate synthase [[Candida] jaroonii]
MIILIDSYDSFTNNLSRLIERTTGKEVVVIHNDSIAKDKYHSFIQEHIDYIDYVVIGPGPGSPNIAEDVGIIPWLFSFFKNNGTTAVPILGICLGFQCLCYNFDNEVKRLDVIKHGQVYDIISIDDTDLLFQGLHDKKVPSVRYHSLFVELENLNSEIVPLAICYEEERKVLMAAKHKSLPFYGVQYHPESICTQEGSTLIKNFDDIAYDFNKSNRKNIFDLDRSQSNPIVQKLKVKVDPKPLRDEKYTNTHDDVFVYSKELPLDGSKVLAVDICDVMMQEGNSDFIILNSASIPGEWSIVGLPEKGKSEVITHSVDKIDQIKLSTYKSTDYQTKSFNGSVWKFLADKFADRYVSRESIISKTNFKNISFPFLGGYIGLMSYEEGQHLLIEEMGKYCNNETPDLKLVFVERFLLLNNFTNKWYYFSVNTHHDDSKWSEEFISGLTNKYNANKLRSLALVSTSVAGLTKNEIKFELPNETVYKNQFQICQEILKSGDSYELCLTTPSKIYLPSDIKSWDIYKILLAKNPSPYSSYMEFEDVTLISSSPERFLNWKGDSKKTVELKPIKGTVKNTPEVDLIKATEILKTPKEMGENLMIVDLIRHDLHQYIENVRVPSLMTVEEYKTVYQLVTTVSGDLDDNKNYHGIDILHTSLPPGSMTGAPKKRSVELLQKIEEMQPNAVKGGRRGIYSGVAGYWSITDNSDWSVIIRSLYHYTDDLENGNTKLWRIGAGGAITVLSDANDEWDEMKVKLESALQAFT